MIIILSIIYFILNIFYHIFTALFNVLFIFLFIYSPGGDLSDSSVKLGSLLIDMDNLEEADKSPPGE